MNCRMRTNKTRTGNKSLSFCYLILPSARSLYSMRRARYSGQLRPLELELIQLSIVRLGMSKYSANFACVIPDAVIRSLMVMAVSQ